MKSLLKRIVIILLTLEARLLLLRRRPKIIAITGSVGKTSTKDAIYAVIKKKVRTRKSEKSFNSEIGVPLTILGLQNAWSNPYLWLKNILEGIVIALFPGDYPEWLVLEIGVDRPGDIDHLASWIRPDIVVLTRLPEVPVHVEFFDSPEAIIEEKKKLVDALKSDGIFIFNNDDEAVVRIKDGVRQRSVGYSRYSPSPFATSGDKILYEDGVISGLEFTLTHGPESATVEVIDSLGVQNAYNYAAAAAVASVFEIPITEVAEALKDHIPPQGRMRIVKGIKETTIIDDSYNSSPVALERALQTLKEIRTKGRKIAVLGDMMELGRFSVSEHEKIGKLVVGTADILVTIGIRARDIAQGALEMGMPETHVRQYEDARWAGKELENVLRSGDVVLVKGSQSIRGERVVEEIMAHPENAEEVLVRQDEMWKQI